MKGKVFLKICSILLIAVCVFGLLTSVKGVQDALAIADYKSLEKEEGLESIGMLEDGINQLKENETTYVEGVTTLEEGKVALAAGQATLAQGYSSYNAGLSNYNQGLEQYNEGKATLEENTEAYNEGKQKLELLGPICEVAQGFVETYNDSGLDLPLTGKIVEVLDEKLVTTYVDGQAQLQQYEEGQVQLEEAEVALSDGRSQLASAQSQLAAGEASLAAGKQKLAEGEAQLAVYEDGEQQVADGLDLLLSAHPIMSRDGKKVVVEAFDERLGSDYSYWQLDENGEPVVKNGHNFLNLEAGLEACAAGRQYIDDQGVVVTAEVLTRIIVSGVAGLASLLGLIAGLVGLFAGSVKKVGAAAVLGIISAVLALGANGYGILNGYTAYSYPLENGAYAGDTQVYVFAALAVMAVIFAIVAGVCKASNKAAAAVVASASVPAVDDAATATTSERLRKLEEENAALRERLDALTSTAKA